jgi:hypothetical protein
MRIDLFSNGNFNNENYSFLLGLKNNINTYHINITTPDFCLNRITKRLELFVNRAKRESKISLEMTIDSLNTDKYLRVLEYTKNYMKDSSLRIGVDGFFLNKNGFERKNYKKSGVVVKKIIDWALEHQVKNIGLAEIYPCMFNNRQIEEIKNNERLTISGF